MWHTPYPNHTVFLIDNIPVGIRCKACGARYSYEKEGCCPGCGAYNRPPKRERVNPDGTVQHMTDAEYARRSKATGKVCFEEKECYEEKVCYEDQARRGHDAHGPARPLLGGLGPGQFFRFI